MILSNHKFFDIIAQIQVLANVWSDNTKWLLKANKPRMSKKSINDY